MILKYMKTSFGLVVLSLIVGGLVFRVSSLENIFLRYESDFQAAADDYIAERKYSGVTHWLSAKGPGENAQYLDFHMGDDFQKDYYKPRIVYVHSDDLQGVHLCSFDGRVIKKIKPHWYICQEDRF